MRRALVAALALAALLWGCGGDPAPRAPGDTRAMTLVDRDGDGTLERGPGEPLPRPARVLGTVAQITDVHLRDEESPARLPVLDRLGPPFESTFRPHEALIPQVLAATVRSLDRIPLDAVVVSGDLADSAQRNELDQAVAVLDGGRVDPDSGRRGYDGVQEAGNPDPLIYRPDVDPPAHPGLLGRAQRPFRSPGLRAPWYPALGNHDLLVAGDLAPDARLRAAAVGSRAVVALPPELGRADLERDRRSTLDALLDGTLGRSRTVPADPRRALLSPAAALGRLARSRAAAPARSAAATAASSGGPLDYAFDAGPALRVVVLDTVRRGGGSEGALAPAQVAWLRGAVAAAGARRVLVFSHHALDRTAGGGAALAVLAASPGVAAAVSGHTHRNRIRRYGGLWLIGTASLADFPQQARVLRLVRTRDGRTALDTFVVDQDGRGDAGVARDLAFLDAQGGRPQGFAGTRADRNRRLPLPAR